MTTVIPTYPTMNRFRYETGFSEQETHVLVMVLGALKQKAGITMDHLAFTTNLEHVFQGNRKKFERVFCCLLKYWNIKLPKTELPRGREFETFPTFHDLFEYFVSKTAS